MSKDELSTAIQVNNIASTTKSFSQKLILPMHHVISNGSEKSPELHRACIGDFSLPFEMTWVEDRNDGTKFGSPVIL